MSRKSRVSQLRGLCCRQAAVGVFASPQARLWARQAALRCSGLRYATASLRCSEVGAGRTTRSGYGPQTRPTCRASASTPTSCAPRRCRGALPALPTASPSTVVAARAIATVVPAKLRVGGSGRAFATPRSAAAQGRRACAPSPTCLRSCTQGRVVGLALGGEHRRAARSAAKGRATKRPLSPTRSFARAGACALRPFAIP